MGIAQRSDYGEPEWKEPFALLEQINVQASLEKQQEKSHLARLLVHGNYTPSDQRRQ